MNNEHALQQMLTKYNEPRRFASGGMSVVRPVVDPDVEAAEINRLLQMAREYGLDLSDQNTYDNFLQQNLSTNDLVPYSNAGYGKYESTPLTAPGTTNDFIPGSNAGYGKYESTPLSNPATTNDFVPYSNAGYGRYETNPLTAASSNWVETQFNEAAGRAAAREAEAAAARTAQELSVFGTTPNTFTNASNQNLGTSNFATTGFSNPSTSYGATLPDGTIGARNALGMDEYNQNIDPAYNLTDLNTVGSQQQNSSVIDAAERDSRAMLEALEQLDAAERAGQSIGMSIGPGGLSNPSTSAFDATNAPGVGYVGATSMSDYTNNNYSGFSLAAQDQDPDAVTAAQAAQTAAQAAQFDAWQDAMDKQDAENLQEALAQEALEQAALSLTSDPETGLMGQSAAAQAAEAEAAQAAAQAAEDAEAEDDSLSGGYDPGGDDSDGGGDDSDGGGGETYARGGSTNEGLRRLLRKYERGGLANNDLINLYRKYARGGSV